MKIGPAECKFVIESSLSAIVAVNTDRLESFNSAF
jgi:hypothetical protein